MKKWMGTSVLLTATLFVLILQLSFITAIVIAASPQYEKIILTEKFYAEGANAGDINKDGYLDVIAGPYWYAGPDFQNKYEIYPVEAFNPEAYSDNFACSIEDLNGDGWPDVFICPHPGTTSYWFENPQGKDEHWKKHLALPELGNESPMWCDMLKNGRGGPIYNKNGYLGFGTFRIEKGEPQWKFHAVSGKDDRFQRYTHGIGYGDINGDGRNDLIEATGWWEQPEKIVEDRPWKFHPFHFADAAANMLVYDVDGDGKNDVITAWHCHLYGLCWYKQIRSQNGEITWEKHDILTATPDENSSDFRISQMHAFYAADMNNDGLIDFVTGKRFWAHGSKGDKEPNAPSVLYWFELKRDGKGGAEFIPHKLDSNSGVGTQVVVVDLNQDGIPDTIASNKKGTFILRSKK